MKPRGVSFLLALGLTAAGCDALVGLAPPSSQVFSPTGDGEAADAPPEDASQGGFEGAPPRNDATTFGLPAEASTTGPPEAAPAGCAAKSCESLGYTCGMNADGCGEILDCGTCPPPEFCGGGGYSRCGAASPLCTPKTCRDLGVQCGPQGDGCGGVNDCGQCTPPEFCGGGGAPGQCGTGMPAPDAAAPSPDAG